MTASRAQHGNIMRHVPRWAIALLTVASAGLAVAAQLLLDQKNRPVLAGVLLLLAAFIFAEVAGTQGFEREQTPPSAAIARRRRPWFTCAALPLAVIAWFGLQGNHFTLWGTAAWLGGLGVLLWCAWRADGLPIRRFRPRAEGLQLSWSGAALIVIMIVGAFFRLYQLCEIPAEMGCDLPHNYNNIQQILSGTFPIFFESFPGREGLFFYLAAPAAWLFGLSHWSIKLTAALVGVVTLPVVYLLGRELFNREVGLYAAALLAVSHWHIILTREGLRMCLTPLFFALVWYFVLRGHRTGRRWPMALAGLCLGLGLNSYTASAIVPGFLALFILSELLLRRGRTLRANLDGWLWLVLVAAMTCLPLARYIYEKPESYLFRTATRITSTEATLSANLPAVILANVKNTLLMFNVHGDEVATSNVAGLRQMDLIAAAMMPLGAAYLLRRGRRGANLSVLLALLVMSLPTTLSLAFPDEVPNAGRAIGALPAAVMLSAVALAAVRRQAGRAMESWRWPGWRAVPSLAVGLVLVVEMGLAYPVYFKRYVASLTDSNYSISLEMARAIDAFTDGQAYIVTRGYWYDGNAVRAQLRAAKGWDAEITALTTDAPPLNITAGKVMVILHPDDSASLAALREAFPRGVATNHLKYNGQIAFITFYGER